MRTATMEEVSFNLSNGATAQLTDDRQRVKVTNEIVRNSVDAHCGRHQSLSLSKTAIGPRKRVGMQSGLKECSYS